MFSSRFMLFPTFKKKIGVKKNISGGGGRFFFCVYAISTLTIILNIEIISRRRRRPGDGRYCNAPPPPRPSVRPSVRLSVCLSVTFSFRTVTQKHIAVFSRNFAGTCTKSWGVLYSF